MRRPVLARLALVLGGLLVVALVLGAAELGLRALGAGEDRRHDPFAGFSSRVAMFEAATRPDGVRVMRTSAARRTRSRSEFLARKPESVYRIFVVGGSSAAGFPYGYERAFPAWLERRLSAVLPGRRIEVVNAAVEGYASRRIAAIVDEMAGYEPDLLIVYMGHNELAERRFYAHLLQMDPRLFQLWTSIASMRLYGLLTDVVGDVAGRPAPDIDFENKRALGEMFAVGQDHAEAGQSDELDRDLAWSEHHYRWNLAHMIEAMRAVGADVMLLGLGQNLADWAPGLSRHRANLDPSDVEAWTRSWHAGRAFAPHDCEAALEAWRPALALDDGHAGLVFEVATCQRRLGRYEEARAGFLRASDLDAVPHGAPTAYDTILREIADERDVDFLDIAALLASTSPHGLVGNGLFLDMVHPNLRAHQLIAEAVAARLRERSWPAPGKDWQEDAWTDPDVAELLEADTELWVKERLGRTTACLLAQRFDCSDAALAEILTRYPDHADALRVREIADLVETRAGRASGAAPDS
jgi:lysophospholipase L1-like esterase